MYSRIVLVLLICITLMPVPCVSLLRSVIAQSSGKSGERMPPPKPGKPEGILPDLDEIQRESPLEREPPLPSPSTVRSSKNPQQPWNGRRVGDPQIEGTSDHPDERRQIRRAHAWKRMSPPPTLLDDQYVQNFFTWAVLRSPNSSELTFWNVQLRVGYAQGPTSVKLVAVALGKTLFESAEYAGRNRDNHGYVYDLYKTFLMRDPDSSGWAFWESQVPPNGRENVRRAFEEAPEFAGIFTSVVPNGAATANAASLVSARVEPRNQPGHGMLTRDATWSVPLLSLPGLNGLELGLALSYSNASAQDWRQIVPLKTTRTEVEQLLGPYKAGYAAVCQLEEGALFIEYSSGPCRPDRKGGWNVPENIVVSMSFTPKHPKKLSALKLDLKYRKASGGDTPSVTYYINDDEGITYSIQMGKVDYVEYGPPKKYDDLKCKDVPLK